MTIRKSYIVWALGCLFLFACRKETIPYTTSQIDLPTEKVLNDICFVNADTFLVCAGTLFEDGLILITTDGGQQFDTLLTANQGINSIEYLAGQYSYSESGQLFHRSTNRIDWNTKATAGWWQWHDHILLPDGKAIVIGGENFGRGFIHTQQDKNSALIYADSFAHQLRRITQNEKGDLFIVGYGVFLRSQDQGQSWDLIENIQSDYYRGVHFPSQMIGYVVGEFGTVFKTIDQGATWRNIRNGNSLFADPNKRCMDIYFVSDDEGYICGPNNYVLRTQDGGNSWVQMDGLSGLGSYGKIAYYDGDLFLLGEEGKLLKIEIE
jgi:photosystem II stability/assembly factor-like uncharacterized protein